MNSISRQELIAEIDKVLPLQEAIEWAKEIISLNYETCPDDSQMNIDVKAENRHLGILITAAQASQPADKRDKPAMPADDVRDMRRAAELLRHNAFDYFEAAYRTERATLAATLERLATVEEGTEVTDG